MLELQRIQECQDEAQERVADAIDMMYIKNQTILEYMTDTDVEVSEDMAKMFVEAATASPVAVPKALNYLSFDNSRILKAIAKFRQAFDAIDFTGTAFEPFKNDLESGILGSTREYEYEKVFPEALIKKITDDISNPHGPFIQGFNELGAQFQCSFDLTISSEDGTGTFFMDGIKYSRISISKTKGFQLDNMRINLSLNIAEILELMPANRKVWAQAFIGIILHEIYHNIAHAINVRTKGVHNIIKSTFGKEIDQNSDAGTIRSKIRVFINKVKNLLNINDREFDEKRTENRLFVVAKIKNNGAALKKFYEDVKNNADKTDTEEEIDQYIKELQVLKGGLIFGKILGYVVVGVIIVGFGAVNITAGVVVGGLAIAVFSLSMLMTTLEKFNGTGIGFREEYYCDMFAAMYKLPVHLASYKRLIMLNKKYGGKVSKARKLENDAHRLMEDEHPATFNRALASYKAAKAILNSGEKLPKDIEEYLQYIVDLHDGITDIKSPKDRYQNRITAPEAPENLQAVLDRFVKKTGVQVNEYATDEE